MAVRVGDWVIQGIKSEFYPCKPDIFAATYEEVDQDGKRTNSTQYPENPKTAIDRDRGILDQITVHEPDDEDDDGPQFAIDLGWDEQTAVLEFIEQFRAIRAHHERRQQ